jgi:hypothetical protein
VLKKAFPIVVAYILVACSALEQQTVLRSIARPDTAQSTPLSDVEITGQFLIEPHLTECRRRKITCNGETYEGTVKVSVSISENGHLTLFQMAIDDRTLTLAFGGDVVDRYRAMAPFYLGDVRLTFAREYLPQPIRDAYIPVTVPHLQLTGLAVFDDTCESELREINIAYYFEFDEMFSGGECRGNQ